MLQTAGLFQKKSTIKLIPTHTYSPGLLIFKAITLSSHASLTTFLQLAAKAFPLRESWEKTAKFQRGEGENNLQIIEFLRKPSKPICDV